MANSPEKQRPTLEDIARQAGVSRSLASLALRGESGVSEKSRRKVLRVAEDLGYRPNIFARNLASATTRTVGIVVGDIVNPFQAMLARESDAAARKLGYEVLLSINGTTDQDILASLDELRAHRVAGVVFIGGPRAQAAIRSVGNDLPVVYAAQHLGTIPVDSVSTDDFRGAAIVVEYLASLGHRRIAYIDGGLEPGAAVRRSGYVEAMTRLGLAPWIIPGNHTVEAGEEGTRVLLGCNPRPTAIFAANDLCALGVLSCLTQSQVSVPQEMTVVGYDNLPIGDTSMVSLTTVTQPVLPIAMRSLEVLARRIGEPAAGAEHLMITPELVVRRTSARPAEG